MDLIFDMETDVCVIGLGTAGAIAAISASRNGASVIGIERSHMPGGIATAGSVWDYYYGTYGGILEEVNRECKRQLEKGLFIPTAYYKEFDSIHGSVKACVLDRFLECCKTMYNTVVTDVFTENGRICGIEVFSEGKTLKIATKAVIDCADGAICRYLGCEFSQGRFSDSYTMYFSKTMGILDKVALRGKWSFEDFSDSSDEYEYSKKLIKAGIADSKQAHYNQNVFYNGTQIGIRGVYTVKTRETYTFEDYINGKRVDDPVFFGFSPVDNPNKDLYAEDRDFQDWQYICGMHSYGISVGIPMGALMAKEYDGLFIAGKAIGLGHSMSSCIRMKADMEKCGEAAGALAAAYTKNNLSYDTIKPVLERTGCLNFASDTGIGDLNRIKDKICKKVELPKTSDEIKAILKTDKPSLALWKIRISGMFREELENWVLSDDDFLRENSAIALGLLNSQKAVLELKRIASSQATLITTYDPGEYVFKWLSINTYSNRYKAICLLGRMKKERELLKEIYTADQDSTARLWAKYALEEIR